MAFSDTNPSCLLGILKAQMNKVLLVTAALLPASAMLCGAVQADEAALFACIEK